MGSIGLHCCSSRPSAGRYRPDLIVHLHCEAVRSLAVSLLMQWRAACLNVPAEDVFNAIYCSILIVLIKKNIEVFCYIHLSIYAKV